MISFQLFFTYVSVSAWDPAGLQEAVKVVLALLLPAGSPGKNWAETVLVISSFLFFFAQVFPVSCKQSIVLLLEISRVLQDSHKSCINLQDPHKLRWFTGFMLFNYKENTTLFPTQLQIHGCDLCKRQPAPFYPAKEQRCQMATAVSYAGIEQAGSLLKGTAFATDSNMPN